MYFSQTKQVFIIVLCLCAILIASGNFFNDSTYNKLPDILKNRVNLGLELQGGSYLQLLVDLDSAHRDELLSIQSDLRKKFRKNKIKFSDLKIQNSKICVSLKDSKQKDILKNIVSNSSRELSVQEGIHDNVIEIFYDINASKKRDEAIINQCIEVIRHRVDETGTKEPHIYRQGTDRIILQLPGVSNPEEVKKLIGQTARLTMRLVRGHLDQNVSKDSIPMDCEIIATKDNENDQYIVEKEVLLTGDVLQNVQVTQHEGQPAVKFSMNRYGAQKFSEITLQNTGKQLAIVLDNLIVSAPRVSHIPTGEGVISGSMTIKDASQLKLVLSSGALPAPLKTIEERIVGPTLGNDSIQDGKNAVLLSFVFVTIFMFLCYSLFGLFACVSLVFNIIFLLAGLSILKATLTLPGIAGIALTIGMAVDANVLIYERIKEELRLGVKPLQAIKLGFERAMTTIVDANITTLIAAAVLYQFGSGPVRGFAVTLAMGIVISMFTALTLTNYQIFLWSKRQYKLESLRI